MKQNTTAVLSLVKEKNLYKILSEIISVSKNEDNY